MLPLQCCAPRHLIVVSPRVQDAPYTLEAFTDGWADEAPSVKLVSSCWYGAAALYLAAAAWRWQPSASFG